MSFNMRYSGHRQALPWVLTAVFLAMLLAGPAAAEEAPTHTPQDIFGLFGTKFGDPFSSVFLNQLFGPLFPSPTTEAGATVFSHLIGFFNTVAVVIAGLLFFWNVTVGILTTAHEGKVLGQRWSSLWAMPRVIFAIGLMVPLSGLGGYNVAQAGVAYIVRAGTNIGSELWKSGARMVINGEIPITAEGVGMPPQTIATIYEMAACMVIVEDQLQRAGSPLEIAYKEDILKNGRVKMTTVLKGPRGNVSPGLCGHIVTPDPPAYIRTVSDAEFVPDAEDPMPGSAITGLPNSNTIRGQASALFHKAHADVAKKVFLGMLQLARTNQDEAIRDPSKDLPNFEVKIREAMNEASTDLREGIDKVVDVVLQSGGGAGGGRVAADARNALLARIEGTGCTNKSSSDEDALTCFGEGWIGAGSWYMVLARLNNELTSLTEARTTAVAGDSIAEVERRNRSLYLSTGGVAMPGAAGGGVDYTQYASANASLSTTREATLQMTRHLEAFHQSTMGMAALGFSMSMEDLSEINDITDSDSAISAIPGIKAWLMNLMNNVIGLGSPTGPFGSSDPMIGITYIGNMLINGSGILMVASVAGGFWTGGGTATILAPIIAVMMTTGGTLAFILPMTPFLLWILAVTGYFLLVVEAVIAVNLWALAHMRLDGDGISGEAGKQGWLMLLSLFMTPALMIFGFFIGMQIFRVTTTLIDMMFAQAMTGIYNGGVFTGFVLVLVYSVVIAAMYMVVIERSFSLVTEFPGKVMRWMGVSADLANGDEGRARIAMAAGGGALLKGSSAATNAGKAAAFKGGWAPGGGGTGEDGKPRRGYMGRRKDSKNVGGVQEGQDKGSGANSGSTPKGSNEDRTGPRSSG